MGDEWTDEELVELLRDERQVKEGAVCVCAFEHMNAAADRVEELNGRVNYLADRLALKDRQFEEIARVLGVRGTPDAAPERMIQQIKALL